MKTPVFLAYLILIVSVSVLVIASIENDFNSDNSQESKSQKLADYMKEKYGAEIQFNVLPSATIQGDHLVNPAGGKLNLGSLKNSDYTVIFMLSDGGFQITGGPKDSTVTIKGADVIGADKNKLWVDGVEIEPTSKSLSISKNGGSYLIQGEGKIILGEKGVKFFTKDYLDYRPAEGRIILPPHKDGLNIVTIEGSNVQPIKQNMNIYLNEAGFRAAGNSANKIFVGEKNIMVFQNKGEMITEEFRFVDGTARQRPWSLARPRKGMQFASPTTLVEQSDLGGGIFDVFRKAGYGTKTMSYDERKAMYETAFPEETFTGKTIQNRKLLDKIKNGEIVLYDRLQEEYMIRDDSTRRTQSTDGTASRREMATRPVQTVPSASDPTLRTAGLRTPEMDGLPYAGGEGKLKTTDNLPEVQSGFVRYKVPVTRPTAYYTPVLEASKSGSLGRGWISSGEQYDFLKSVSVEGSGLYQDKKGEWWYVKASYDKESGAARASNIERLTPQKANGWSGGTGLTPTLGTVALPSDLRYKINQNKWGVTPVYVPKPDGEFYAMQGADGGGDIRRRMNQGQLEGYNIDFWGGRGLDRYNEMTRLVAQMRLKYIYVDLPIGSPRPQGASTVEVARDVEGEYRPD